MNPNIGGNLSRRQFVKTSSAFLGAAMLAPNLVAENSVEKSPTKKRDIKKAIMLATVPGGGSFAEKFKLIKDAGIEGVEPMGSSDRDEILKARDASGIKIPSVCCATHWAKPLSDPNPAVRAEGVEGLKTALHDAKAYGASSVLMVPGVVNKQIAYDDAYKRSQAELRKVIPLAEELGVKIAIENVWNNFLLSPLEAARFVDELNSPMVGWHFDIGNVIAYGWPEHWIRALGTRIQKLHVKEYSRQKRDSQGMWKGFEVDYLEGDNNWPEIVKALDEVGYHGWAIAEPAFHPPNVEPAARLKQISEKMDRIFAM